MLPPTVLRVIGLSCVLSLVQSGEADAEGVAAAVATEVARSVVEITASQCSDHQSRTGSGFVFEQKTQIVTAHHVVVGCRMLRVHFERAPTGPVTLDASLAKVLASSDLAMLVVTNPPEVPPLKLQEKPPSLDVSLVAIGYSLEQPSLSNLDVGISIGSAVLRAFLPPDLARELRGKTQIDIDSRIIRLKSPLEPGMSGGPITDAEGKVVAIVAGGLRNGTVPVSWGWPASLLKSLVVSSTRPEQRAPTPETLFAMVKNTAPRVTRQCGGLVFARIGTRSYGDISQTADDRAAVFRVAAVSTRPRTVIDQFEFDVWRHSGSGATVAVPAGLDLMEEGDRCTVRSDSGQFEEIIQSDVANNQMEVQLASVRFEQAIVPQYAGYMMQPDIFLTSPGPSLRPDGLVVNRKGVMLFSPLTAQAIHVAETLMARGGTVAGIAAVNHSYGQQYQPCIFAPGSYQCQLVADELTEFTKFVLAVQLSTYPVY